jgi:hypothetical protein
MAEAHQHQIGVSGKQTIQENYLYPRRMLGTSLPSKSPDALHFLMEDFSTFKEISYEPHETISNATFLGSLSPSPIPLSLEESLYLCM